MGTDCLSRLVRENIVFLIPQTLFGNTIKSLAEELGNLTIDDKVAYCITFVVDPEGIIQWICANNLDTGRNVNEVLRILDALQTGALTPCNWAPGQKAL